MCVRCKPRLCSNAICAAASASISVGADAAREEATEKRGQPGREEARVGVYKSGNLMRRQDRLAIDEHQVTANP